MLEGFFKQILPEGLTGSIIASLVAILFLAAAVCFLRETFKRFASNREGTTTSPMEMLPFTLYWGRAAVATIILAVLFVTCVIFALKPYPDYVPWVIAYVFAVCFGGSVGAAELISRYRDAPDRALRTMPSFFYIALNAGGSLAALYLIYVFRVTLGFADETTGAWKTDPINLVKAVMLAGFSSLLFFRTSLFKFKAGDSDLAIGPSIVLDTLLGAADRAVDRAMAQPRADFVHGLMSDISFEKASVILPSHCLSLMQNVTNEETQRVAGVVNELRAKNEMPDKIKALNLGLALLSVVGQKVLNTAVTSLKHDLQSDLQGNSEFVRQATDAMRMISFEPARRMLPPYIRALWPTEISKEAWDKLILDLKALSEMTDVSDIFKSLILGIRLARLTDVPTLRKAVEDLGRDILVKQDQSSTGRSTGSGATPP